MEDEEKRRAKKRVVVRIMASEDTQTGIMEFFLRNLSKPSRMLGLKNAVYVEVFGDTIEAGSDPRGDLGVTWGVYLCAGKPPLAHIIISHPPDLTRCDSVIGLAIPAMSGHIQYRSAASGDLYIRISGIHRVLLS